MTDMLNTQLLAQDITNLFYSDSDKTDLEKQGSINYWNHVHTIEDIITHFIQGNDLTLDNDR